VREILDSHKLPIHPHLHLKRADSGIIGDTIAVLIDEITANLRHGTDVADAGTPYSIGASGSSCYTGTFISSARHGITIGTPAGVIDDTVAVVVQPIASGGRTIGRRAGLTDTKTPNAAGAGLSSLDALPNATTAGTSAAVKTLTAFIDHTIAVVVNAIARFRTWADFSTACCAPNTGTQTSLNTKGALTD